MKSFNKITIPVTILVFALIIIWPLKSSRQLVADSADTLLTAEILGDGTKRVLPIPLHVDLDARIVALGEKLFHDPILSEGGRFSCASCHPVNAAGMDGLPTSLTFDRTADDRNTPTIFNVGLNPLQTWQGTFNTLEDHLDDVINNLKHFNTNWADLVTRLQQNRSYPSLFRQVLKADINRQSVTRALTSYQRSLITPNADFDRYLRGDTDALADTQKKGYQLFIDYGCISCHQGINLGGNLFARFGIYKAGYTDKTTLTAFDYGRYNQTGLARDKFVFRVPSLRNVARTAPYFHNGSVATLPEAIQTMARVQLNIELPEQDVLLIESFLQSLTGEYRGEKL